MKNHFILLFTLFLFVFSFYVKAQLGITSDSIRIDGHNRTFHFQKPRSTKSNGSLMFVLHGSGGSGKTNVARDHETSGKGVSRELSSGLPRWL